MGCSEGNSCCAAECLHKMNWTGSLVTLIIALLKLGHSFRVFYRLYMLVVIYQEIPSNPD